jgi:hypothetical protein
MAVKISGTFEPDGDFPIASAEHVQYEEGKDLKTAHDELKADVDSKSSITSILDVANCNDVLNGEISDTFKVWAIKFAKPATEKRFNSVTLICNRETEGIVYWQVTLRTWTQSVLETKKILMSADNANRPYTFIFDNSYDLRDGIILQVGMVDKNGKTLKVGIRKTTNYDSNLVAAPDGILYSMGTDPYASLLAVSENTYTGFNYSLQYIAKKFTSDNARSQNLQSAFDFIMPDKIYLLQNKELWFYDDNIVENSFLMERTPTRLDLESTVPTSYDLAPGHGKIIGSAGNATLTFKIKTYDLLTPTSKTPVVSLTKPVSVVTKAAPTGKTINTLVVGDSFIENAYGEGILKYIDDLATADGNTMEFVGTKTVGGGFAGEGRGGWTETDYLSLYVPVAQRDAEAASEDKKMPSPFVFSDDDTVANSYFSMTKYMTDNSIATINNVVFCLGMNGGNGSGIDAMITNMKAAIPDARFFVSLVPSAPKALLGSTWGRQNSVDMQLAREKQNKAYIALFNGRTSERIYLMPTNFNVDRLKGIQHKTVYNKFQFSDLDNATETLNDGIHPTALGAKSIAYVIYNYLAYTNA